MKLLRFRYLLLAVIISSLCFVNAAFAKYDLAACIKGVLNAQGYDFGNPVPPLEALPADTAMRLSELAASLEEGGMV